MMRLLNSVLLIGGFLLSIWAFPGNAAIAAILGVSSALVVGHLTNRALVSADKFHMHADVTRVLRLVSAGLILGAALCAYKVIAAQYPIERSLFANAAGVLVGGALSLFSLTRKSFQ